MLGYITWLTFILSVALAAGSIVLSTRLRNRFRTEVFSTLLYHLVFVFTFGFYGIWGQVVIRSYLSSYLPGGLSQRLADIAILLGLPFLIFSWFMLIRLARQLSGRIIKDTFTFWFLFLNISALAIIGYYIIKGISIPVTRNYYVGMNALYTITAAVLLLRPARDNPAAPRDRTVIAFTITLIMLVQSAFLIFFPVEGITGLIYTLLFFAGNVFLPVFLTYGPVRTSFGRSPEINITFEDFCKRYEVSPREKDIVREICNGLSNKEISERLFISLQTVKDHTHRIYIKTNVKSRAQLMNLVRDTTGRRQV
jgi:DNA-binding CsgD family transcriptional regulator